VDCPCCGRPFNHAVPAGGLSFPHWGPKKSLIVDRLVEGYPKLVRTQQMVDALYSMERDGGPLDPVNTIRVMIWGLRPKLQPYGWTLSLAHGGWRLERLAAAAQQEENA